jgi:hypothetical protein
LGVGGGQLDQKQRVTTAAYMQVGGAFGTHDVHRVLKSETTQGDGRHARNRHPLLDPSGSDDADPGVAHASRGLTQPRGGGGVGQMDVIEEKHEWHPFGASPQHAEECSEYECLTGFRIGEGGQLRSTGGLRPGEEQRTEHGDVGAEDLLGSRWPYGADHRVEGVEKWLEGQRAPEFVTGRRYDVHPSGSEGVAPGSEQT